MTGGSRLRTIITGELKYDKNIGMPNMRSPGNEEVNPEPTPNNSEISPMPTLSDANITMLNKGLVRNSSIFIIIFWRIKSPAFVPFFAFTLPDTKKFVNNRNP